MNNWTYDEFKHCGVDYSNIKQAENYDSQHQKFRNYEQEYFDMMNYLSLENTNDLTLIDLGCGTGAVSIYASKHFKKIYAVDVSDVMIDQAKGKIKKENIHNIEFVNSGFLNYENKAEPVDLVVTKAAFHHLPDFWKQIALLKINKMLKIGGIFYILDTVFHFQPTDYMTKIDNWISDFELKAGKDFKTEVEIHIKDEFSTFDWILEGMLKKAGFKIEKSRTSDGFITEYVCKKIEEINISEK